MRCVGSCLSSESEEQGQYSIGTIITCIGQSIWPLTAKATGSLYHPVTMATRCLPNSF